MKNTLRKHSLENARSFLKESSKKKEYNLKLFSTVSLSYQKATRFLSFFNDQKWKKHLCGLVPSLESPVIADLASGTGDIAQMLSRKYKKPVIIAADQSREMLEKSPANVKNNPSVTRCAADMCNVPLKDSSVDIVTGGYALRNAPSLDKALDETARILKPGGCAAFLDFSHSDNYLLWKTHSILLTFWGNLWGIIFHANPRVYGYIAQSLAGFPKQSIFHRMIRSRPMRIINTKQFFFGLIEITVIRRLPTEEGSRE